MTMRDGDDHPMTVEYDKMCVTICPIPNGNRGVTITVHKNQRVRVI